MKNEFRDFAVKHMGLNGLAVDDYMNITSSYISPTIIEERQLNVAQMDVFSRLMMDRIIFLGTQIDDYTANVIQAQLLYLDSSDPGKDISIYINSPGGSRKTRVSIRTPIRRKRLPHSKRPTSAMSRRFAQEWRHRWLRCCSWLEKKANVLRLTIRVL